MDVNASVQSISAADYSRAKELRLVPGQVLCGSPDTCTLGPEAQAAVTSSGSDVLVWDFAKPIRAYGAGHQPKDIGRNGAGPGEYRVTPAVGSSEGGGIDAYDVSTRRLVRFDSTGAFLRFDNIDLPVTTQGAVISAGHLYVMTVTGKPGADGSNLTVLILGENRVGDTVGVLELPSFPSDGRIRPFFPSIPVWAISPDGSTAISAGDEYTILVFSPEGRRTKLQVEYPKAPVRAAELDSLRESLLRRAPIPQLRKDVLEAARLAPKYYPSVTQLTWLKRGLAIRETSADGRDSIRWTTYDLSYRPFGYFNLPSDAKVLTSAGDSVLLLLDESTGVQSLQWYRVEP